jgi:rare lipoprotein A
MAATPQRPPAAGNADAVEQLYGYGARQTARVRPAIDLRGAIGPAPAGESLALDAFDAEPDAVRAAPENAVMTPISAPAAAPSPPPAAARPEWLETERTGAPYEAMGQWYVPTAEPNYAETGQASWYGAEFAGRRTASGEAFDPDALTAAHPTLPMPSLVQITNLENGREVIVRINDRGPFHGERLIDVSRRTAEVLGFQQQGSARVHVRYLGPAPKRVNADGALAPAPVAAATPVAPVAVAQPQAATGQWVVQVGAFSDPANVARARDVLGATGVVSVDATGRLQRVRVGAWTSRGDAEAARSKAVGLGYAGAVVALR